MTSTSIYCVYLTIYRGNKLPPFYIGSSSVKKVENGYHGSVESKTYKNTWKEEIRLNPSLFRTIIIFTSEHRKLCYEKEEFIQRKLNVLNNPLYTNLCYANSKFDSTNPEIRKSISAAKKGIKFTEERKKSMIKNREDDKRGKFIRTEQTKKKISKTRKSPKLIEISLNNLPESTKGTLNGMHKQNRNYNTDSEAIRVNRIKEKLNQRSKEQNIKSYSRKKTDEERQKLRESAIDRHVIYVSRIFDRKVMDLGNYTKWLNRG